MRPTVEHQRMLEGPRRAAMRAPGRDQMFIEQLIAEALELAENSRAGF
jgi:hypothetical protein